MSSPGNLTGIERRARRAKDGADGADADVTYDAVIAALGFVPARTGGSGPANTDALAEGTSNLYFTEQRVRDTPLDGLSLSSSADVVATDRLIAAIGKLQAQITTLLAGPLSQFGSTTSAQLAGVISDETGSGALVFANAPTLVNPVVGTQAAGDNSTKAASTGFVAAAVAGVAAGIGPGTATIVNTGGASALPAAPQGYAEITLAGSTYLVPYYLPHVVMTLNAADKDSSLTLSNGNLTVTKGGTNGHAMVRALSGVSSGKWYWEVRQDAAMTNDRQIAGIALATAPLNNFVGASANGYGYDGINGFLYHSGIGAGFGSTFNTGDVIGVAFDATAGKIWFAKNNVWQGSGNPATGANPAALSIPAGTWFPATSIYDVGGAATEHFSAVSQTYAAPSGFSAFS